MAVAPKFAGHIHSPPSKPVHTVELYLDYVCPFSAKLFSRLYNDVFPLVGKEYAGKVQFIFRHQVQPWHPSSTLVHEAALAVEMVDRSKFWEYSNALFENQVAFFDVNVVNETRNETYERLASLAEKIGVQSSKVYNLLQVSDKAEDGSYNIGNQVTYNFKLHVRAARQVSVHVSPTVFFNGNVENSISSGWELDQWRTWIQENVA